MHIFIRKPFFDTLTNCQKIIFAPLHTVCVFLDQQKTLQNLGKTSKKILDGFSTQPWTDFQLKNPPNLGRIFNSTAYIYVYVCIYALWSYLVGQVWLFEVLSGRPSCFLQTLSVNKNIMKIGVQSFFEIKKKLCAQIPGVIREAKLAFLCCSKLGLPDNIYLTYLITPENSFGLAFFAFKMCGNTRFCSVFEHQPNFGPKMPPPKW